MRLQHIHPEARAEFDEAFEYYLQIDRELAKAFDSLFRYYRQQI